MTSMQIYIDISQYCEEYIDVCQYRKMESSQKMLTVPCCPPLLSSRLSASDAKSLAALFRVLSEPARLQILSLIAAQPTQEVCACELVEHLGLSQPTVSHHLKVMYEAGLLEKERRGNWIYYRVVRSQLSLLKDMLS